MDSRSIGRVVLSVVAIGFVGYLVQGCWRAASEDAAWYDKAYTKALNVSKTRLDNDRAAAKAKEAPDGAQRHVEDYGRPLSLWLLGALLLIMLVIGAAPLLNSSKDFSESIIDYALCVIIPTGSAVALLYVSSVIASGGPTYSYGGSGMNIFNWNERITWWSNKPVINGRGMLCLVLNILAIFVFILGLQYLPKALKRP